MFRLFSKKPKQLTEMEIATIELEKEERKLKEEYSKYKEPVQSIAKAIITRPKTFKIYSSTSHGTTYIAVVDTVTKLTHSYSKKLNTENRRTEYSYSKHNLLNILTGHEILFLKRILLQTREERLKAVKERKRQRITKLYQ